MRNGLKTACVYFGGGWAGLGSAGLATNLTTLILDSEQWLENFFNASNWAKLDFFIPPWIDGYGGAPLIHLILNEGR